MLWYSKKYIPSSIVCDLNSISMIRSDHCQIFQLYIVIQSLDGKRCHSCWHSKRLVLELALSFFTPSNSLVDVVVVLKTSIFKIGRNPVQYLVKTNLSTRPTCIPAEDSRNRQWLLPRSNLQHLQHDLNIGTVVFLPHHQTSSPTAFAAWLLTRTT